MLPSDLSARLAAEHVRDLHRVATRSRLIALARCCKPSALAVAARRVLRPFRSIVCCA
jgi:hypothetical protein